MSPSVTRAYCPFAEEAMYEQARYDDNGGASDSEEEDDMQVMFLGETDKDRAVHIEEAMAVAMENFNYARPSSSA